MNQRIIEWAIIGVIGIMLGSIVFIILDLANMLSAGLNAVFGPIGGALGG